jgi:hypothetical protein
MKQKNNFGGIEPLTSRFIFSELDLHYNVWKFHIELNNHCKTIHSAHVCQYILLVGQGLTFQQSPKHPGLVNKFLHGHQVLNFTEGHQPLDIILWEYILEDNKLSGVLGGLSGFMRSPNFIHSKLSASRPSTLSIFFTLETRMGGSCAQEEAKQQNIWKTQSWLLSSLIWLNRSLITVLYVNRTIANYGCHLI